MEDKLYQLHLEAGRIYGKERTCGTKAAYETEEAATRAANAHNNWSARKHDVEPYPCAFCSKWHIGRVMPLEELEAVVAKEQKLKIENLTSSTNNVAKHWVYLTGAIQSFW